MSYDPAFKDATGKLEQFAWPGGYLIEWVEEDSQDSLCAACADAAEAASNYQGEIDLSPLIHEAGSEGFSCDDCGELKQ